MFETMNNVISWIDGAVWGLPLIILILCTGIYLSVSMGFLQIRHLGKALKFMVKNEEGGKGEVSSFGALCTAMSATIGTGNIVGVATALAAGGPGSLFWMVVAAFFGIYSPVNMIFFMGFVLSLVIIFTLTVALSRVTARVRKLAQMIALQDEEKREK